MIPKGGHLPEQFAGLAVDVTGASAALIGVLGERKELGMRHAALGLSRDQAAALRAIEQIMESEPNLTVVPDITRDHRFATVGPAFQHSRLRVLIYMKLVSPGGEPAGFICLLGEEGHAGLTRAAATSLGNIASIVMSDRQREQ